MTEELLERHIRLVHDVLQSREIGARKRFGQHFLVDAGILRRIVGCAGDVAGRSVLEIGVGPACLTAALLERGARVSGFEIDRDWAEFAREELADQSRFELIERDALAEGGAVLRAFLDERRAQGDEVWVVANLPYQVASPILVELVSAPAPPTRIVATVQLEVADRLCAAPGSAARGLLTLLVEFFGVAQRQLRLKPGSFRPPPRVHSAVVRIDVDPVRQAEVRRFPEVLKLVRAAFQGRRKMLRNTLARVLTAEQLARLDSTALQRRPQELSREDWLELAETAGTR